MVPLRFQIQLYQRMQKHTVRPSIHRTIYSMAAKLNLASVTIGLSTSMQCKTGVDFPSRHAARVYCFSHLLDDGALSGARLRGSTTQTWNRRRLDVRSSHGLFQLEGEGCAKLLLRMDVASPNGSIASPEATPVVAPPPTLYSPTLSCKSLAINH
jgi:hypothetical protein